MSLRFVLLVVGVVLAVSGWRDLRVVRAATAEPVPIELAALEAGAELESTYVRLGPHVRLYPAAVRVVRSDRPIEGEPADDLELFHLYYPVLSPDHPFIRRWDELLAEYGNAERIPTEELPRLATFRVVVKSEEFAHVGSIPDDWVEAPALTGLVLDPDGPPAEEDREPILAGYPDVELDRLLVLEAGREPPGRTRTLGMLLGGVVLCIAGSLGPRRSRRGAEGDGAAAP